MIAIYDKYFGKLKKLEQHIEDIKKGDIQILIVTYENREEHSNKNKKYYIKSNDILEHKPNAKVQEDIELEYDNIDDFCKEFDFKDENTRLIIHDIIDTTEAERAFWQQAEDI